MHRIVPSSPPGRRLAATVPAPVQRAAIPVAPAAIAGS